jgi:hypothetical protein
VTIDGAFLKSEARAAVRQYFAPLTAPFKLGLTASAEVRPAQTRPDRS